MYIRRYHGLNCLVPHRFGDDKLRKRTTHRPLSAQPALVQPSRIHLHSTADLRCAGSFRYAAIITATWYYSDVSYIALGKSTALSHCIYIHIHPPHVKYLRCYCCKTTCTSYTIPVYGMPIIHVGSGAPSLSSSSKNAAALARIMGAISPPTHTDQTAHRHASETNPTHRPAGQRYDLFYAYLFIFNWCYSYPYNL